MSQVEIKQTFEDRIKAEQYFLDIRNGQNALIALNDFYNNVLRPIVKHGLGDFTEEQIRVYEDISEKFWQILHENRVDL